MPDPVDTDALRRDARVLSPGFPGVEKRLHAAADELAHLRAVIENAPHTLFCKSPLYLGGGIWDTSPRPCTCWKADVL